ncbi:hypothetical protein T552_04076 [Pneumocystis carinii B80]|uniref:Uncharacterized protein n=1 Tax=Pneumocystis carinii (strain B80) TaxID=1408658 RepID=A0A0W4ZP65_PNEC8|nr:hypothetical protein T552_04076 [Pneumocystis carinii B80]KTW30188.1 hypothetical protein T552_04076 [Pneumocystis carinii B80]
MRNSDKTFFEVKIQVNQDIDAIEEGFRRFLYKTGDKEADELQCFYCFLIHQNEFLSISITGAKNRYTLK